ncbi:MAG TPA: DMT family transporter [Candidatus Saccharicenans sp.]|jgi:drug/metabolite transporter (DMT)-like permease|nr:DMT family transporter [Candidatus Saccharicenans sp.]HRD01353.1 DMT family transporter [Candidatus Saccharicenans sp.]
MGNKESYKYNHKTEIKGGPDYIETEAEAGSAGSSDFAGRGEAMSTRCASSDLSSPGKPADLTAAGSASGLDLSIKTNAAAVGGLGTGSDSPAEGCDAYSSSAALVAAEPAIHVSSQTEGDFALSTEDKASRKLESIDRPAAFGLTDLLMILTTIIWGANVPVIKVSFSQLSPQAFNLTRFLISSALYALILWRSGEGFTIKRQDLPRVIFLSLTGITFYQVFFITGLSRTAASLVSMSNAITPVLIALLSAVLGFERLRPGGWLGILLSVAGLYAVVLGRPGGFDFKGSEASGIFFILLSCLMWALYTIYARPALKNMSPLKMAALTNILGTVFYLPFAWKDFARTDFSRVSLGGWLGVLYSALLALVLASVIWYKSIERIGGARTGVFSNLTPVFGILTACIFLHDRITWIQVMGMPVIFFGVYLARNGHKFFNKMNQKTRI